MPIIGQQTTGVGKAHSRKKAPPKRKKQADVKPSMKSNIFFKNEFLIEKLILDIKQRNSNPPSLLSSPVVNQKGSFIFHDDPQVIF